MLRRMLRYARVTTLIVGTTHDVPLASAKDNKGSLASLTKRGALRFAHETWDRFASLAMTASVVIMGAVRFASLRSQIRPDLKALTELTELSFFLQLLETVE